MLFRLFHTFPDSKNVWSWRARPKSDTLAWSSSEMRTFLAAKSRWITFLDSKYSMPLQVSLK